jgi:Ca2+-binding EF-hand superfamily protein
MFLDGITASRSGDDDILDLMEKFDTNHDGKLAYHEFVKLLQVDDAITDI